MLRNSRAVSAMGWRQKVCMPSLTHCRPVLAGTMWSFMSVGRRKVRLRAGRPACAQLYPTAAA